jgi:hypothetical protein
MNMAKKAKTMMLGLQELVGERVLLLCMNYFYTGKLVAVDETDAALEDVSIVYETGEWGAPSWKDAQPTLRPVTVRVATIESYMRAARS